MNRVTHKIILDVKSTISQQTLDVYLNDSARRLEIAFAEDNLAYKISSGCRAVFTAEKPDGTILYNDCAIIGNSVVFDFIQNPQIANILGEVNCQVKLYGMENDLITSPRFTLVVHKTVYREGDAVESSSEFTALTKLITEANKALEDIGDIENILNPNIFPDAFELWNEWGNISAPIIGQALSPNVIEPNAVYRIRIVPGKSYNFTSTPLGSEFGVFFAVADKDGICLDFTAESIDKYDVRSDYAGTVPAYIYYGVADNNNISSIEFRGETPTEAPVKSVNGKTGDVKLSADDVGARASTWMPSYSDVGAEKSGTATAEVGTHNTSETSHNDIRWLIEGLADRLNAVANSRVNVADIIDNLTTSVSNKPLSAKQGVALKALVDAIKVPTKVSELSNDSKYIKSAELTSEVETALENAKESGEFDGKTPVKGTDYFTEADKAEIISEVESTLSTDVKTEVENQLDGAKADIVAELITQIGGLPVFGTVDDNNTIAITSALADGVYVLKYENDEGTLEEIGTITIGNGEVIKYTNLNDPTLATDTTLTPTSTGWMEDVRINSSKAVVTADGYDISNFVSIPADGEVVRIKNFDITSGYGRIYMYSNGVYKYPMSNLSTTMASCFITINANYAEITVAKLKEVYEEAVSDGTTLTAIRFGGTLKGTIEDVIITIDEEITVGSGETDEPTGEIDISEYGYEDNKRLSTTSGTISSSAATGYTTIGATKKIPIARATGQVTTINLSGITWTDKDLTTQYAVITLYVGGNYTSGNCMYLKTLGDFSDVGIRGVLNDDGTITVTIYDGTKGLMFDGFMVCGVGSGANAKITVITK